MSSRVHSSLLYERLLELFPGGANSAARAFTGLDLTPLIVKRGEGDLVEDVDGRFYIDFCMGWGSLILGHAYPKLTQLLQEELTKGWVFGITHTHEEMLASLLMKHYPSIEKVRFLVSGTEAVMASLRLARGYTGRTKIVKFEGNYHGHLDALLVKAGSAASFLGPSSPALGVPEGAIQDTITLEFNDCEGVKKLFQSQPDIAAVIVEPMATNMGLIPASKEFLSLLREETKRTGAILIFDEVVTGFRIEIGGAQAFYEITPDLTCFGKIVGGGFPASAVGGKKEIMDCFAPLGQVFQAGTFAGMPLAMLAGSFTIKEIERVGFYEELNRKTDLLLQPINAFLESRDLPLSLHRVGSLFSFFFGVKHPKNRRDLNSLDRDLFRRFFHQLFHEGIYLSPSPFEVSAVSFSHSEEHLIKSAEVIRRSLQNLFP